MSSFADGFKPSNSKVVQIFLSLPEERRRQLVHGAADMAGAITTYLIYRKLGAPRWAALGLVDISLRLDHLKEQVG